MKYIAQYLQSRIQQLANEPAREKIYLGTRKLQEDFHHYLHEQKMPNFKPEYWEQYLNKLGLTSLPVTLEYNGKKYTTRNPPKIEVHSIRPTYRFGREGKRIDQVIISLSQTVRFTVDGEKIRFRGGSVMILNLSNLNEVDYVITKNIKSSRRFAKQLNYQLGETDNAFAYAGSTYEDSDSSDLNFKKLHFSA